MSIYSELGPTGQDSSPSDLSYVEGEISGLENPDFDDVKEVLSQECDRVKVISRDTKRAIGGPDSVDIKARTYEVEIDGVEYTLTVDLEDSRIVYVG